MNLNTMSIDARLRNAAALLLSLPATVAAASFAHGHGALGAYALLAALVASIAIGGVGAYLLLSLLRKPVSPNSGSRHAAQNAAAAHSSIAS